MLAARKRVFVKPVVAAYSIDHGLHVLERAICWNCGLCVWQNTVPKGIGIDVHQSA